MNLEKRTQKKEKRKEGTAHPGGLSLLLILNHIQWLTVNHHWRLPGVRMPERFN